MITTLSRLVVALGIATVLPLLADEPDTTAEPVRYRLSDCHLHLVDFLQRTDGARAVLAAMDRAGVDEAMISGMPLVKEWARTERVQPQYYLDDDGRCYWYSATDVLVAREVSALPEADRKRLHPFICGFNGADRNAVDHVKRMLEWYPDFWAGIGEVMARHDDLTALTYGDPPSADWDSLAPIYELAAENDLPVSIHSNISSVWRRKPVYLEEMENALRKHPKTRFIWCHAGVSRRIVVPTLAEDLRRLLTTYSNLSIDISWVFFDAYLMQEGKPDEKWVALIEEFPTRFLIGSDKVGKFADYPREIQRYYRLLDALKPETAKKVGRDNFLALLPKRVNAGKR